jgi:hypothetical protein
MGKQQKPKNVGERPTNPNDVNWETVAISLVSRGLAPQCVLERTGHDYSPGWINPNRIGVNS